MWTDVLGNPVNLEHAGSLGGLNDFVEGFIASEARAVDILQTAAVDAAPLVQACAAAVHMFAETRAASSHARHSSRGRTHLRCSRRGASKVLCGPSRPGWTATWL